MAGVIEKNVKVNFLASTNGFNKSVKDIEKSLKSIAGAAKLDKLNKSLDGLSKKFSGAALGVMFFGMQLRRTFEGIIKTGVKTFQRISEANDMAAGSFQILGAWVEFLWFTIGRVISEALEPFLFKIVEVILAITNWIQQNPKLFAAIMIAAVALGIMAFTVGTLRLAMDSVIGLQAEFIKAILSVGKAVGTAFGAGTGGGLLILLGFLAAIFLIIAALAKFPDSLKKVKDTFKDLGKIIENVFNNLFKNFGINISFNDLWVKLLALIAVWFEKIIALNALWFGLLITGIGAILSAWMTAWATIGEVIIGVFDGAIKYALDFINILNKIPGMDIDTSGIEKFEKNVSGIQQLVSGFRDKQFQSTLDIITGSADQFKSLSENAFSNPIDRYNELLESIKKTREEQDILAATDEFLSITDQNAELTNQIDVVVKTEMPQVGSGSIDAFLDEMSKKGADKVMEQLADQLASSNFSLG